MFFIYAIYGSYFIFLLKDNWYRFFNLKSFRNITNNPYFLLCTDVLERNSYYYQQLSKPAKDVFAARTIEFLNDVEWEGFNEFEIKDKHKILIAASAVQLTFGFKNTEFENLKRIFIAPTQFYSRIFQRDVKGLTMPIAKYLSWQHFEEGIKTNNDALNLGLHEFAHALDIQFKKNPTAMDNHFLENKRLYEVFSNYVMDMMNSEDNYVGFLREYAKTNESEFFAVAVECFFERPQLMKDHEPKLFFSFCKLLNQNPLNTSHNYRLDTTENNAFKTTVFNQNYFKISAILMVIVGFSCIYSNQLMLRYFNIDNSLNIAFFLIFVFYLGSSFLPINKTKFITVYGLIVLGVLPIIIFISQYF